MVMTDQISFEDYDGIEKQLPQVVRIEPASVCNLKCIHCSTGMLENNNRGVMSVETFQIALREIEVLNPRVVVLYHGGEPFINKNIFGMIRQLKSRGVGFIKTVTNGMLLDESMILKIIQSGLDSIEFSLDGNSPEENDEIRVGSNYQKVLALIKQLITLKHDLASEIPEVFVANCQIPTQSELEQGNPVIPNYIASDFSQYDNSKIKFKTCFPIHWTGFPVDTSKYRLSTPVGMEQTSNYCEHPVEQITIRHNGDVVACCYDITSTYVLGNIKEVSIKDIWNNERYRALRRSFRSKSYLPLCENCNVVKPQRFLIRKSC
ncbi:radical SAM/SPASM domain-containing protein [Chloroflexota bacterium]